MKNHAPIQRLLTKVEMADELHISVRKFDYFRAEGWVPQITMSQRTIRFDPTAVVKAFAERFGKPEETEE
jgi:hypothetical protein